MQDKMVRSCTISISEDKLDSSRRLSVRRRAESGGFPQLCQGSLEVCKDGQWKRGRYVVEEDIPVILKGFGRK